MIANKADPFQFDELQENLKDLRGARVGGYRIVYEIDLDKRKVYVLSIRPRGQAYDQRRAPKQR